MFFPVILAPDLALCNAINICQNNEIYYIPQLKNL